jgi:hypothetical protein
VPWELGGRVASPRPYRGAALPLSLLTNVQMDLGDDGRAVLEYLKRP